MSMSLQVNSLQLRLSAAQQNERCEWHTAHASLQSTLSEVRAQVKDVDVSVLVGRVGELQEQLLQCQKENMELRFELEQAVTNLPRMKVCMPLFVQGRCVCVRVHVWGDVLWVCKWEGLCVHALNAYSVSVASQNSLTRS